MQNLLSIITFLPTVAAVILARRLHVHRALPGPSWFFPDPDLSARVRAASVW